MSAQAETACHPHPSAGKRPAIHSPSATTLVSPPLRLPAACLPPRAACSLPATANPVDYFSISALQKYQIFPPVQSYTRSLFSKKEVA